MHQIKSSTLFFPAIIAATAFAAAGAIAQVSLPAPGTYDWNQLPETKGVVKQYVLGPRGNVDGLILQDGTEVNFPPHLGTQIVFAIKPGDNVSVRGLRARMTPLIDAVMVRNDASGAQVADTGPEPRPDASNTVISSRITQPLYGRQGEVNGVLLEDGTIVRLPPHEAARLSNVLIAGSPLSVSGSLNASPLGRVLEAWSIGATQASMTPLDRPPLPRGPKG